MKATPSRSSSRRSRPAISRSTNGSSSARVSTSVTDSPSAAKIDAYSTPMTPAPRTIIDRGIRGRRSTVVLSNTVSSSNAMSAGRLGAEPVAITITSPRSRSRTCPSTPCTAIVCASRKRPSPRKISIA